MTRSKYVFSCGFIVILTAIAGTLGMDERPEKYDCPDGFPTDCGANCYLAVRDRDQESWEDAQIECQRLGGNLASIRNQEEQICVGNIYNMTGQYFPNDKYFWIGLHVGEDVEDVTDPDRWKWVDSSVPTGPGTYKNWAVIGNDREPNSFGDERCAIMVYVLNYRIDNSPASIVASGVWNNIDCHDSHHYICEVKKSVLIAQRALKAKRVQLPPRTANKAGPTSQRITGLCLLMALLWIFVNKNV